MKTHLKPHSLLQVVVILLLLCMGLIVVQSQTSELEPGTLRNPLNNFGGPDPWLTYYDGYYYLATTSGTSDLFMSRSATLAGLKVAIPVLLYHETEPSRCCNMWAPEFHLLENEDGELRWYYYYTAGTSGTLDNQRMHVLESAGTDPMGPYTYKARLFDPANDTWAIDASVMQLDGNLYLLFSSWVGAYQNLFIAPMSNPWTISGRRVLLTQSEYEWERSGLNVTEGPVALQRDGRTFIIYSASFCATADYALGMLTYNGGDPLATRSWEKYPEPVFQRSDENSVFGTGHNGFFRSPDGTEDWIVYHANDSAAGVCDDARTTRVQRFTWNEDGTPNFGIPVSTDEVIQAPSGDMGIDPQAEFERMTVSSFRAFGFDSAYLRRIQTVARVDVIGEMIFDAQFYILPGLADPDAVSIVSASMPGYYLTHQSNAVIFAGNDGSSAFADSATWWIRPGLADDTWVSLEAFSQPNRFVGKMFGVMALVEQSDSMSDIAREDATFELITGE